MNRMPRVLCLVACLSASIAAGAADLEVLKVVGEDEYDVLLYRPTCLQFSNAGLGYLLNAGNSQVLVFGPGWEIVNTFGAKGSGPGEFENAHSLLIVGEEVWVVQPFRITIFTLEGQYVDVRQLSEQIARPTVIGNRIFATAGSAQHVAVELSRDGRVINSFGPECGRDDYYADYRDCAQWTVLPAAEFPCLLINQFDSRAVCLGNESSVGPSRDLGLGDGIAEQYETNGGSTVVVTNIISHVCPDLPRGYWVVATDTKEDRTVLCRFDTRLQETGRYRFSPEVLGNEVAVSPRRELVVINTWDSILYVCAVPAG